jgi:hypothetical protein
MTTVAQAANGGNMAFTPEEIARFAEMDREAAEYAAREAAAPKFWIVFASGEHGYPHMHALFATEAEAEQAVVEMIGLWIKGGDLEGEPPADFKDAVDRFYDAGIYFNVLEAPLGFWTDQV